DPYVTRGLYAVVQRISHVRGSHGPAGTGEPIPLGLCPCAHLIARPPSPRPQEHQHTSRTPGAHSPCSHPYHLLHAGTATYHSAVAVQAVAPMSCRRAPQDADPAGLVIAPYAPTGSAIRVPAPRRADR